jgi:hypothetical protein
VAPPPLAGATRYEIAFAGTPAEQAELLRRMVEAGHRVSGFAQATSNLEEIFLRVTGQGEGQSEEPSA